jgi:hypothetical protein
MGLPAPQHLSTIVASVQYTAPLFWMLISRLDCGDCGPHNEWLLRHKVPQRRGSVEDHTDIAVIMQEQYGDRAQHN